MKVMCISNSFCSIREKKKFFGLLKSSYKHIEVGPEYGEVVTVIHTKRENGNIDTYKLAEYPFTSDGLYNAYYNSDLFIPLSQICETEMERTSLSENINTNNLHLGSK